MVARHLAPFPARSWKAELGRHRPDRRTDWETGTLAVPNTGWAWNNDAAVTKEYVALTGGQHVLRLCVVSSYGNYNWMEFTANSVPPPRFTSVASSR